MYNGENFHGLLNICNIVVLPLYVISIACKKKDIIRKIVFSVENCCEGLIAVEFQASII